MKKILCLTVAAILVAGFTSFSIAGDKGSWTGWIADANCAKNYEKAAKAAHVGCAQACVKKGAKWALALKDSHFILDIEGSEAEKHLGREVTVKGEFDKESNTIKVSSVGMASE
ncbi:hypothetical protein MYX65_12235 [Acidobacteria bacterium AH-259-L09]|nr:hypothetical protein [Acidobacteria bacterium AH-259-L09]